MKVGLHADNELLLDLWAIRQAGPGRVGCSFVTHIPYIDNFYRLNLVSILEISSISTARRFCVDHRVRTPLKAEINNDI
jgi:hypothetical protein